MSFDLILDLTGLQDWTQVRALLSTGTVVLDGHGRLSLSRDDEDVLVLAEGHGS